MDRQPAAILVIDPRREKIAVLEANKLGIPVISLIDTDSDPDRVSIAIPGNDDAIKSIQLVCRKLVDAISEGKEIARGTVTPLDRGQEAAGPGAEAPAAPATAPSADAGAPSPAPESKPGGESAASS
jgi:small subunit ribosomal protein S2